MKEVLVTEPLRQVSRKGLSKAADVGDSYLMCLPCMPASYTEKSTSRKGIWTIAFGFSLFLCAYGLALNFAQFLRFPVQTSISLVSAYKLEFPAVTVCNHNPILRHELKKLADRDAARRPQAQVSDYFEDAGWDTLWHALERDENGTSLCLVHAESDTGEELSGVVGVEELQSFVKEKFAGNFSVASNQEKFLELYSKLPISQRRTRGHQLGQMLMACRFNQQLCDHSQFLQTINTVHGNCYTFTIGKDGPLKNRFITKNPGPMYGLELELFIEQEQYVRSITDVAGVRVVIHNQTYMPFADREGFTVSPGTCTYVSLRRVEQYRASQPYGVCMESDSSSPHYNYWRFDYPHIAYTSTACKLSCYQWHVNASCNCGDKGFPLLLELDGGNQSTQARPCDSVEDLRCMRRVRQEFDEKHLLCYDVCLPLCQEVTYRTEISFGQWPSIPREGEIRNALKRRSPDFAEDVDKRNMSVDAQIRYIRENTLKLVIYFSDLEYESIMTETSYSWINLMSDQGGQVGLWVGVSILTIFEFVEVMWDCIAKRREARRKGKSADDAEDEDEGADIGEEAV